MYRKHSWTAIGMRPGSLVVPVILVVEKQRKQRTSVRIESGVLRVGRHRMAH